MFNSGVKKEALEKLNEAERQNSNAATAVAQASEALTTQRHQAAEFIGLVESYINGLANTPKEFKRQVAVSNVAAQSYKQRYTALKVEAERAFKTSVSSSGAGVGLGAGIAAFGPSAAMGVAMTFGTASTGTAISALSGAAATNAALAWLGGGALAAGGGGMVAGNAFLALAGPVGWGIGGVALVGSGVMLHWKNAEIAEEANKHRAKVVTSTQHFNMKRTEINTLKQQTSEHVRGGFSELNWLTENAPQNYHVFSAQQRQRLGALVNHTRALGESIGKKVSL